MRPLGLSVARAMRARETRRAPPPSFSFSQGDTGGKPALPTEPAGTRLAYMQQMLNTNQIKPGLPVVCSNGGQFAVVDRLEGADNIKLNKDEKGQHHFIPVSWVKKVDDKVHVDRPGDQAMREWSTKAATARA